ncbi:hypothetical protein EP232_02730 [bacterium]|nr:MAG: hypothetical protein EP232_02730 [bacterium]
MTFQKGLPQIIFVFLLILLLSGLPATTLAVSDISAVTSLHGWEEEDGTDNSSASQYFDLWTRTGFSGFNLDIEGAGRLTVIENEVEPGDENLNRLYSLALTLSTKNGNGSLVLGRQMISAITDLYIIDGFHLNLGTGPFSFNTRWGYLADVDTIDLNNEETFGLGVDLEIISGMSLALDYARTFDSSSILTELIAMDWTWSWFKYTKAYITLDWDLMSENIYEAVVGTRIFLSELITATLEYYQNQPLFSSDSIYSAFAVDPAETFLFSVLFTPNARTRYWWELSNESYETGEGVRYTIGAKWSPGRSNIITDLTQYDGDSGKLSEIQFDFTTSLSRYFDIAVGGDLSSSELPDQPKVLSYAAYAGGQWTPSNKTEVSLRIEQTDDDASNLATLSGRLALALRF